MGILCSVDALVCTRGKFKFTLLNPIKVNLNLFCTNQKTKVLIEKVPQILVLRITVYTNLGHIAHFVWYLVILLDSAGTKIGR